MDNKERTEVGEEHIKKYSRPGTEDGVGKRDKGTEGTRDSWSGELLVSDVYSVWRDHYMIGVVIIKSDCNGYGGEVEKKEPVSSPRYILFLLD